jgi:hypothetical protein
MGISFRSNQSTISVRMYVQGLRAPFVFSGKGSLMFGSLLPPDQCRTNDSSLSIKTAIAYVLISISDELTLFGWLFFFANFPPFL